MCDDLTQRPSIDVALKPLKRYVARVRAVGVAKDGRTKMRSDWSAHSVPVALARRMGGGFGLVQTAAAEEAMAKAKRRSIAGVARVAEQRARAGA